MVFDSLKSVLSKSKSDSKEKKSSFFSDSGEFGDVKLSKQSDEIYESSNSIVPNSKSSKIFGDMINKSNKENNEDLFTLKKSNNTLSVKNNEIKMDSIKDLANPVA